MKPLALIVGTRPQLIKTAPLLRAADEVGVPVIIVHTGQHYDDNMSGIFLNELGIGSVVNLNVGSHNHNKQIALMLNRIDDYIEDAKPFAVMVPGDTNSAAAGALAAAKRGLPTLHVEGGIRNPDGKFMPEETNRKIADHCSTMCFAPTYRALRTLEVEGVDAVFTGDVLLDTWYYERQDVDDIISEDHILFTSHRQGTSTYAPYVLRAIREVTDMKIVFPKHPRIELDDDVPCNVDVIEPVGYYAMAGLINKSALVITDSGGLQRESVWSGKPCITFMCPTWTETLERNANRAASTFEDLKKTIPIAMKTEVNASIERAQFGDGKAAYNIMMWVSKQLLGG